MWMYGIVKCCKSVLESWISKCGVGNKIGNAICKLRLGRGRIFWRFQVDWTQTHVVIAPCLPSPQPDDAGSRRSYMYKEVLSRKNVIRSWSWVWIKSSGTFRHAMVWFRPQKRGLLQRNAKFAAGPKSSHILHHPNSY